MQSLLEPLQQALAGSVPHHALTTQWCGRVFGGATTHTPRHAHHPPALPPSPPPCRVERALQGLLDPLQQALADGCHLSRDTGAAVEAAGFESVAGGGLARLRVEGLGILSPHVAGVVAAPRASAAAMVKA
jgi:hypothetical protein